MPISSLLCPTRSPSLILCTIFSTILGAMTALTLWRFRFPFKNAYEGFVALPIVVPEICMGVAVLMFFSRTGMTDAVADLPWPFNLTNIVVAHIAFSFPFVLVVVHVRAWRELQPPAGRGLEGSGRDGAADLLQCDRALHGAGPDCRRAAGLHLVAR